MKRHGLMHIIVNVVNATNDVIRAIQAYGVLHIDFAIERFAGVGGFGQHGAGARAELFHARGRLPVTKLVVVAEEIGTADVGGPIPFS